jgi:hypothetical protein
MCNETHDPLEVDSVGLVYINTLNQNPPLVLVKELPGPGVVVQPFKS